MNEITVTEQHYRLLNLIYDSGAKSMKAGRLIELGIEMYKWSPSTIYTMIYLMRDRKIIEYKNAMVTVCYTQEEIRVIKLGEFLKKYYNMNTKQLIEDTGNFFEIQKHIYKKNREI